MRTVLDKLEAERADALGSQVTTVDFSKFWRYYLGESLNVTHERLRSAKDLLLGAGTPARTAMYYFIELGSMVRPEDLRLVEDVQYELQDMV